MSWRSASKARSSGCENPRCAALLEAARAELGTTTAGRLRFRMSLLRRLYEEYGRVLGAAAYRSFEDVEKAVRQNGYLDAC